MRACDALRILPVCAHCQRGRRHSSAQSRLRMECGGGGGKQREVMCRACGASERVEESSGAPNTAKTSAGLRAGTGTMEKTVELAVGEETR